MKRLVFQVARMTISRPVPLLGEKRSLSPDSSGGVQKGYQVAQDNDVVWVKDPTNLTPEETTALIYQAIKKRVVYIGDEFAGYRMATSARWGKFLSGDGPALIIEAGDIIDGEDDRG